MTPDELEEISALSGAPVDELARAGHVARLYGSIRVSELLGPLPVDEPLTDEEWDARVHERRAKLWGVVLDHAEAKAKAAGYQLAAEDQAWLRAWLPTTSSKFPVADGEVDQEFALLGALEEDQERRKRS